MFWSVQIDIGYYRSVRDYLYRKIKPVHDNQYAARV